MIEALLFMISVAVIFSAIQLSCICDFLRKIADKGINVNNHY